MYKALYRKYRPKSFNEVVGQDVIVKTLSNALKSNKISHAYMFCGPRGTGKTSFAKIFARAINCLAPIDGIACDNCSNCEEILANKSVDIIEIDAASNNGVDEIRELRNKVSLVPATLKYKVYIIDEVHMLSTGAFNALLKTLEEPPHHAIFILATTDPHKVPITIVSRCQVFNFKRVSINDQLKRLKIIADEEHIDISDECLKEIAINSDGGMRDAIGLLDQVASYSIGNIVVDDIREVAGSMSREYITNFAQDLLDNNASAIIEKISELANGGKDFVKFINELITYLQNLLTDKYLNNTELKYDEKEFINKIEQMINIAAKIKTIDNQQALLTVGLLKIINQNQASTNEIISREIISNKNTSKNDTFITEKQVIKSEPIINTEIDSNKNIKLENANYKKTQYLKIRDIRINNTFAKASKQALLQLKENWSKVNDYILDKKYGSASCLLADSNLRAVSEENIIISYSYDSMIDRAINSYDKIKEVIKMIFEHDYNVVFLTDNEWQYQKTQFIIHKNEGKQYEYIEEPKEVKEDNVETNNLVAEELQNNSLNDITKTAISLFGQEIVEIK